MKEQDKSGSCAVIVLIVNEKCFVANVGDSRAVISTNFGQNKADLTLDHKPNRESEFKRIVERNGQVFNQRTNQILNYPNVY